MKTTILYLTLAISATACASAEEAPILTTERAIVSQQQDFLPENEGVSLRGYKGSWPECAKLIKGCCVAEGGSWHWGTAGQTACLGDNVNTDSYGECLTDAYATDECDYPLAESDEGGALEGGPELAPDSGSN